MRKLIPIAILAGSLVLAMAILALALAVLSRNPAPVLLSILQGAFGSRFGFSETLLRTVPVLLCALAAAIPAAGSADLAEQLMSFRRVPARRNLSPLDAYHPIGQDFSPLRGSK